MKGELVDIMRAEIREMRQSMKGDTVRFFFVIVPYS